MAQKSKDIRRQTYTHKHTIFNDVYLVKKKLVLFQQMIKLESMCKEIPRKPESILCNPRRINSKWTIDLNDVKSNTI